MSERGESGNCFRKIGILTWPKEEDAENPVALFRGDAFRVTETGAIEQLEEGFIIEVPVK